MYLLDTNVISEVRKPRPHGAVLEWIAGVPGNQLYISSATLGELQSGIELTRRQDPDKAHELEVWLDSVPGMGQVIAVDGSVFREFARLAARKSRSLEFDALIAATARVHQLTVVTRNVRDFENFNVPLLNPFSFGAKF